MDVIRRTAHWRVRAPPRQRGFSSSGLWVDLARLRRTPWARKPRSLPRRAALHRLSRLHRGSRALTHHGRKDRRGVGLESELLGHRNQPPSEQRVRTRVSAS